MSDSKLAMDARMSKAQSPTLRRLKFTEEFEGFTCVGNIEVSQYNNQEGRDQRRDPIVFAIREFGPSWGKTCK